MTLAARLDAIREGAAKRVPEDKRAAMAAATRALRESGILAGVNRVGEALSPFALENHRGDVVRSVDLLARGPLVVTVYRGSW